MKILTTYMLCTADPIRVESHLCGEVMGVFVFPFAKHLVQLMFKVYGSQERLTKTQTILLQLQSCTDTETHPGNVVKHVCLLVGHHCSLLLTITGSINAM